MAEEGGIKRLYPVIVGVALVGSLYFLWSSQDAPIRAMPDDKEAGNPFLCTACGYSEEMSPHERAEWIREKGQNVERGGVVGGPRTSMRRPSLACRQCNEMTLQLATKCLKCNKIFSSGECPVCIPEVPDEPEDKGGTKPRRGSRR